MVRLLVRLAAPWGRIQGILHAPRSVMWPAQLARGCSSAQIYLPVNDDRRVDYMKEWDDADAFRRQIPSDRFVHLPGVLEMSAERTFVEFRVISETHGLEYIASETGQSRSLSST
jgi:hypothetical protein